MRSVLYQQHELHRTALETGLSCMAFNLAVIGGSLLVTRLGLAHRVAMAAGLAGVAAGAVLLFVTLIGGYVVMGASLSPRSPRRRRGPRRSAGAAGSRRAC